MVSPRSVRFDDELMARLEAYVRAHPGTSVSSAVVTFVEESLRLTEHPGIVFRHGPAGRRAGLADGPDVWEVVSALHDVAAESPELMGEALVEQVTLVTGLSPRQVRTVVRYYAAHRDEVDERVEVNRRMAEREESLWRAQQSVLRRAG